MKFFYVLLLGFNSVAFGQWTEVTSCNQIIMDIKSFDNKLFLVGNFTENESETCYWSAYYNGSAVVRHPTALAGGGLNSLEVFNNYLYGVGSLNHGPSFGISRWTGASWVSGGSSSQSHSAIFADVDTLYVGSDFGQMKYKTGSADFVSMPPMDNTGDDIRSIIKFNNKIYIAGKLNNYNGVDLNNIGVWDGSDWQTAGDGLSGEVYCMTVYDNELYVGGKFNLAGGVNAKYIAKWNGSSWSDVGGSMTGSGSNGLRDMVVYHNMLFVVGDFDEMGGVSTENVAYWNGTNWNSMSLTSSASFAKCIEVYNNKLYVGMFDFTNAPLYCADAPLESSNYAATEFHLPAFVTNQSLQLDLPELPYETAYSVVSLNGATCISGQLNAGLNFIDCSSLAAGIYLVQIMNVTEQKIIYGQKFGLQ